MLALLAIAFFVSGATGLVYQLTWHRLFAVVFGNSTHAVAVVVAVFIGGLSLGSYLAGRFTDRLRRPALVYGCLELAIAVSAMSVPALLALADPLFAGLYQSGPPSTASLLALRIGIAALALVIPTCLLGATLPVVVAAAARRGGMLATQLGTLYGLNTLGAALGTVLSAFLLIPTLGVALSLRAAAGTAALLGLVVIAAALRTSEPAQPAFRSMPDDSPDGEAGSAPAVHVVLAVFFVGGLSAMACEVVWTRLLEVMLGGSTTRIFAGVLTLLLVGFSTGSLVYSRVHRRLRRPVVVLALVQLLIALCVTACAELVPVSARVPGGSRVARGLGPWLLESATLTLLPTMLMGFGFPLCLRLATRSLARVGRSVGAAYAVNALGSALGPLLAGFVLVPALGTGSTLALVATLNAAAAASLVVGLIRGGLRWATIGTVVLLGIGLQLNLHSLMRRAVQPLAAELAFFAEGAATTVAVWQQRDGLRLSVGGLPGAGTHLRYRAATDAMARIPLALHERPEDVLVVGFGTGRTPGLFVESPRTRRVDVVELSPAVLEAGRTVFPSWNLRVLESPKLRLFLDDGFNVLRRTPEVYDVISVDSWAPWVGGSSSLYTREFYSACSRRLKSGGLFIQWAFGEHIGDRTTRIALATLATVFRNTAMWRSREGISILLVASNQQLLVDPDRVAERLADVPAHDPLRYPRGPGELFDATVLDDAGVRIASAATTTIHTLDRPLLELLPREPHPLGDQARSPLAPRPATRPVRLRSGQQVNVPASWLPSAQP